MTARASAAPGQGLFITFEGIDGAGKSTHIPALAQALRDRGRAVIETREPGGTPLAEGLREWLLRERMDALTEALLMFAARREHLLQVIEPALAQGQVVLCDRYTDATFAYQGHGRGFDLGVLATLERWVQASMPPLPPLPSSAPASARPQADAPIRQPHLTLWFDLPAAVAAQRLAGARLPDKFEAMPQAFFERVSAGYAARAQADPGRFARIDATATREAVWEQVLHALRSRGWL